VAASVTSTVALCPGYLGATLSQRRDLAGQGRRIARLAPVSALAGIAGALLLLRVGDAAFAAMVPFLILLAAVLIAVQEPLRAWLTRGELARGSGGRWRSGEVWVVAPVALAGVYGGYFGAGMGVMLLAALGIALGGELRRLNALKQLIALIVNAAAALSFAGTGRVAWPLVAVMAVAALAGGALGGLIAARIPPRGLRVAIVALGVGLAGLYWVRGVL
jgi:uncharacterized membrane protein YfcA